MLGRGRYEFCAQELLGAFRGWGYQDFAAGVITGTSVTISDNENGDYISFDSSCIVNSSAVIVNSDYPGKKVYTGTSVLFSTIVSVSAHTGASVTLSGIPHASWPCRIYYLYSYEYGIPINYTQPSRAVAKEILDERQDLFITEEEIGAGSKDAVFNTLENTPIGGTTPNTGAFTSLTMTNAVTEFSTDGTLGGDSDSAVPTEKAVKAYVDAAVGAGGHTHDTDTLQLDGISSNGGAFGFTTSSTVTFNSLVAVPALSCSGNIGLSDGGTISVAAGPSIQFDSTNTYLEMTGGGSMLLVGINTTAPACALHAHIASAGHNVSGELVRLQLTSSSATPVAAGFGEYMNFYLEDDDDADVNIARIEAKWSDLAAGDEDGDLLFYNYSGGSLEERMKFQESNVYITGPLNLSGAIAAVTTITASDLFTLNQSADDDGIQINGYDDKSGSYTKINVDSTGRSILDCQVNFGFLYQGSWRFLISNALLRCYRDLEMKSDSYKYKCGAANDAEIWYDGVDLCIDPQAVGTGTVDLKIAPTGGGTADKHTPFDCTSYITLQFNGVAYKVPCEAV